MNDPLAIELPPAFMDAIVERVKGELRVELAAERDLVSPWLSVSEAAQYLRVSERTLDRCIARGRVRSTTLGRRRLLHRDDLDALARRDDGRGEAPTTPPRRRRGLG